MGAAGDEMGKVARVRLCRWRPDLAGKGDHYRQLGKGVGLCKNRV